MICCNGWALPLGRNIVDDLNDVVNEPAWLPPTVTMRDLGAPR